MAEQFVPQHYHLGFTAWMAAKDQFLKENGWTFYELNRIRTRD